MSNHQQTYSPEPAESPVQGLIIATSFDDDNAVIVDLV